MRLWLVTIGLYVVFPGAIQSADAGCGAYCLYTALLALDVPVESLDVIEKRLGPPPEMGYSAGQLAQAAKSFGVHTLGVETTLDRLMAREGRFTAIVPWGEEHFVTIGRVRPEGVTFVDGVLVQTIAGVTFGTKWNGHALLLSESPLLPEESIELPRASHSLMFAIIAITVVTAAGVIVVLDRYRSR